MISRLERAQEMMRYLYQHPHTTSDQLAQALHIPASTIRRTLGKDFPKSFQRHKLGGYVLPDPIIWPGDIEFDLAVPISDDEVTVTPPVVALPSPSEQWYRDTIDELRKELKERGRQVAPTTPKEPDKFSIARPTQTQFQEVLNTKTQWVTAVDAAVIKYKATPKDDKDYWDLYNTFKAMLIYMSVQVAKDPSARIKDYIK